MTRWTKTGQTEIRRHVDIVGAIFWTFGVIAFCLGLPVLSAVCICLGIAILLCNIETRRYKP